MKRLLTSAIFAIFILLSVTTFAKTINLYSEPKTDSKTTGTVNTAKGVTIVYTPKSGEWIKVANPENGDVGWVKSGDLGSDSYKMRITTSSDGSRNYSIYQFGSGNNQYNQQQIEMQMRQFEHQRRLMRMQMAQMFSDLFYFPQPVFIPVVYAPNDSTRKEIAQEKATNTPQANPAATPIRKDS